MTVKDRLLELLPSSTSSWANTVAGLALVIAAIYLAVKGNATYEALLMYGIGLLGFNKASSTFQRYTATKNSNVIKE